MHGYTINPILPSSPWNLDNVAVWMSNSYQERGSIIFTNRSNMLRHIPMCCPDRRNTSFLVYWPILWESCTPPNGNGLGSQSKWSPGITF
ncbi:hypothetical protein CBS11350_374 [Aspergillus niger]|nr:hypothetical protein CBS11350_374 [Aspergillus niger]